MWLNSTTTRVRSFLITFGGKETLVVYAVRFWEITDNLKRRLKLRLNRYKEEEQN
jgi:hypothetical protein